MKNRKNKKIDHIFVVARIISKLLDFNNPSGNGIFLICHIFKRFYLFLERRKGREKERERNTNV